MQRNGNALHADETHSAAQSSHSRALMQPKHRATASTIALTASSANKRKNCVTMTSLLSGARSVGGIPVH